MTLIALTSQNRRDITEHAGRCRNFLVFDVQGTQIGEPRLLELPPGASLHDMASGQAHALDGVQVLISASMGDGLRHKLAERGIEAQVTSEREPLRAVQRYVSGDLPVVELRPAPDIAPARGAHAHDGHEPCGACNCGHAHSGHGHRHGGGDAEA